MEYYLALKRDEILIRATTRMNLENILSKISQTQRDKYCIIPMEYIYIPLYIQGTQNRQIHRQKEEYRLPGSRGRGD